MSNLQLYDTEKVAVHNIKQTMALRYGFKGVETIDDEAANKKRYSEEVIHRIAELGLVASVTWSWESDDPTDDPPQSPWVSDDPADENIYWYPKVIIEARIDANHQFDHERQQREVASGILDGKKGYVREDGTFHEDPIKKIIT